METNIPPCKASETIFCDGSTLAPFTLLADPVYIKIQPPRAQLEGVSVT